MSIKPMQLTVACGGAQLIGKPLDAQTRVVRASLIADAAGIAVDAR